MRDEYTCYASLKVFLDTLDYDEFGVPWLAGELRRIGLAMRSLVDIGGGDGRFTGRLLREIGLRDGLRCMTVVEPSAEALGEYRQLFDSEIPALQIEYLCSPWLPNALGERQYSLVVASHSLYGVLEGQSKARQRELVASVFRRAELTGAVYVALAGRSSAAYQYKDAALRLLGFRNPSVFGEDVAEIIPERWEGHVDVVNSSMRLPERWGDDPRYFVMFNEYFLRVEKQRLASCVSELWCLWNRIGSETWTGRERWQTGWMRHCESLQFYTRGEAVP
jgi:hypothetical protein